VQRSGQSLSFREVRQISHYPDVHRPVIAMAKQFDAGTRTGWHAHARAQLLFAISGLMVASTAAGTWVVPAGHALWIPVGLAHDVSMHGSVAMRTAYIREEEAADLHQSCRVLPVGALLEAALISLIAESETYAEGGRGGHLAWIILDEVRRAAAAPFELPIPQDRRLERLTSALLQNPASPATIDEWAEEFGVSRRTLTRLFRSQTGLSFGTWRRRLRLLTAAARQADGEPIGRVAASLGYESLAAFRAMARREFGATREAQAGGKPFLAARRDRGDRVFAELRSSHLRE
jgi:AraC-like DNA-binding protein/mannose-6-phosphate isomerase-like protein (cupin superfamily)